MVHFGLPWLDSLIVRAAWLLLLGARSGVRAQLKRKIEAIDLAQRHEFGNTSVPRSKT